jgi:hypothetical protein
LFLLCGLHLTSDITTDKVGSAASRYENSSLMLGGSLFLNKRCYTLALFLFYAACESRNLSSLPPLSLGVSIYIPSSPGPSTYCIPYCCTRISTKPKKKRPALDHLSLSFVQKERLSRSLIASQHQRYRSVPRSPLVGSSDSSPLTVTIGRRCTGSLPENATPNISSFLLLLRCPSRATTMTLSIPPPSPSILPRCFSYLAAPAVAALLSY